MSAGEKSFHCIYPIHLLLFTKVSSVNFMRKGGATVIMTPRPRDSILRTTLLACEILSTIIIRGPNSILNNKYSVFHVGATFSSASA